MGKVPLSGRHEQAPHTEGSADVNLATNGNRQRVPAKTGARARLPGFVCAPASATATTVDALVPPSSVTGRVAPFTRSAPLGSQSVACADAGCGAAPQHKGRTAHATRSRRRRKQHFERVDDRGITRLAVLQSSLVSRFVPLRRLALCMFRSSGWRWPPRIRSRYTRLGAPLVRGDVSLAVSLRSAARSVACGAAICLTHCADAGTARITT